MLRARGGFAIASERTTLLAAAAVAILGSGMFYSAITQDPEKDKEAARQAVWSAREAAARVTESNDPDVLRRWIGKEFPYPIPRSIVSTLAQQGRDVALRVFLEEGWPADGADKSVSPLQYAINRGNMACAVLLLKHGADPDRGPAGFPSNLYYAVTVKESEKLVDMLLDAGADPNRPSTVRRYKHPPSPSGSHPQGQNGLSGRPELTEFSEIRATPLYFAAEAGRAKVVALLLARGADPKVKASNGQTPLQVAQAKGHKSCETLLGAS